MMPTHRHRPLAWIGVLALAAGLPFSLPGQDRSKTLTVGRIGTAPQIDGRIDDACWQAVQPVAGFFQYDPVNGTPASEETLVWAAYDQNNLYFAFLMKDAQPDRIWAELTPRNEWENNDSITLILDAYNDKRTSIEFELNPRGVQKNSVETIWRSGAVLREDGWSAEMAIPFKSLRFSSEKLDIWGVNFERYIHRLNETDYWTDVDRDLPKLQQTGELRGLSGLRPGYNLEFFPYAGYRWSEWEEEAGETLQEKKGAAGLDIKWGIRPNVYLDVTASPDFSEVESDPFIYQLSPYENYLRENRPFFTEGSRYFNLSSGDEYHDGGLSLFYSRRIGNPKIAGKVTGKSGGFGFGILGALNKAEEDGESDSFFGTVRVQKDILKNSQVGIYYSGVSFNEGVDPDLRSVSNHNVAFDYNFNFKDFYYIRGMSAFTFNRNGEDVADSRNGIHQIQFQREPDAGWQIMSGFQRIEENVDIRTGYIDQIDIQSFDLMTGYAWRYNKGAFKRFSLDIGGMLRQDSHGNPTGRGMTMFFWTEFFNRIEVHGGFDLGRSKYQVLDAEDELVWTADYIDTYGGNLDFSWERGGFLKEISLEGGWEKRGIYNDEFTAVIPGAQTSVEGQLVLRPRSNFELSAAADWIRQTVEGTGEEAFSGIVYEAGFHYQVTRSLFLNTRLFGENRENQYSLDVLLGYYFGAGNIVQLSFKKSERNDLPGGELVDRLGGWSVTLKVSYLLRI